jgi:hypothetical protein
LGIILNVDDVASMSTICEYVGVRPSVVLAGIIARREII